MKIINAYIGGLKIAFDSKKMIFVIFVITLILALFVAIPFRSILSNAVGNSMSTYILLTEFDYTAYRDFLTQNKLISSYFNSQILLIVITYWFLTIIFSGGIFYIIHDAKNEFSLKSFLEGCRKYFSKFFSIGLIFLFIYLISVILIFISFAAIIESKYDSIKSEDEIILIVMGGIFLFILLFIFFSIINDYTKIILVKNYPQKVFKSFLSAIVFTIKNILTTYSLYLFLLIVPIIMVIAYLWLDTFIGMTSAENILIMLIVQQLFIFSRIFIKVWVLASQYTFHYNYHADVNEEPENDSQPILEEWNLDDLKEPESS